MVQGDLLSRPMPYRQDIPCCVDMVSDCYLELQSTIDSGAYPRIPGMCPVVLGTLEFRVVDQYRGLLRRS